MLFNVPLLISRVSSGLQAFLGLLELRERKWVINIYFTWMCWSETCTWTAVYSPQMYAFLSPPHCQDTVRQRKFLALIYSSNVLGLWEKMREIFRFSIQAVPEWCHWFLRLQYQWNPAHFYGSHTRVASSRISKIALLLPLKSLVYEILFYFLILVQCFNNYVVALTSFHSSCLCLEGNSWSGWKIWPQRTTRNPIIFTSSLSRTC